jgi:hypothetical protein
MTKRVRYVLPTAVLLSTLGILDAAPVPAMPLNTTNTQCQCYFDEDCPQPPGGIGFCVYTGCDPIRVGALEKIYDGMCGTAVPEDPASAGSSCASVSPVAVAKTLRAWASAFDKAGARGGGPVGTFTAKAYKLSHLLIPSIRCRFEIARRALDLQVLARGMDFLDHPDPRHAVEDHVVQDISEDKCRQQVGKISARALQLEMMGATEKVAAQLSQIPEACPAGQTLGGLCEGAADEIACLGSRLQGMAQLFATQPRGVCGDGVVSSDEQCETDSECDGNRCSQCRCVSTICGLVLCGNGNVDAGEECDDGNTADNDACQNCKSAVCGDGVLCDHPSCTSGRDGGPESCDPPGAQSPTCLYSCLPDCSCEVILE